jgi:RNA polymerase sigma factor (sigma-70 family)
MGGDDAELVRRHLSGDPEAFRLLYEKYGDKVFASAYRIVGEYHAAADLVQEVFVKIHGELRHFKFESKFSTWLFRVAVNHALNRSSEVARHARIHEKIGKDGRGRPGGTKEGPAGRRRGPPRPPAALPQAPDGDQPPVSRGSLLRRDRRDPGDLDRGR